MALLYSNFNMESTVNYHRWKWILLIFLVTLKPHVIRGQYEDENNLDVAKIFKCCQGKKNKIIFTIGRKSNLMLNYR